MYAPQLSHYDYIAMEETLAAYEGRDVYSVPSGFGLQGTMGLYLFMRNPAAEILVSVPPDHVLINPWWYGVPNQNRVKLVPVRGNSQLAVANSVVRSGGNELLAFCEFDEHLSESEEGNENAIPWRLVEKARQNHRMTVVTRVLRPKEESSSRDERTSSLDTASTPKVA